MPSIDLERLIVRQSYFIPIKAFKLKVKILKELKGSDIELFGVFPWHLDKDHGKSMIFLKSIRHAYIYSETLGDRNEESVKIKGDEYDKGLPKTQTDFIKRWFGRFAYYIHIFISKKEANGCTIDVECLPVLYQKICVHSYEPNEFEIQDASISCRRFLKTIFEGGLSGTLLTEKKTVLIKSNVEVLINDASTRQITDKIDLMFTEATGEILIIGWV